MAVFSVNQATQFYAGSSIQEVIMKDGSSYYVISGTDANGNAFTERTDIIKPGCIISEIDKTVADFKVKATTNEFTFPTPVKGQHYLIRLNLDNWLLPANYTGKYLKTVAVVAPDTNATNLAAAAKTALENAFKREVAVPFTVAASNGKLTIAPKAYHTVGKNFTCPNIEVTVENIATSTAINVTKTTAAVSGTGLMKLKDLEFFCAGEKGDRYRGVGYPNEIPFVSRLTGITESSAIKTIHYYETLSNEAVQKSEKTLILVGTVTKDATPGGAAQS